MRNIEIKAQIINKKDFAKKYELASKLTDTDAETFEQQDLFFNSKMGRLKLRTTNNISQLIHYNRLDSKGPKLSEYTITEVKEPDSLAKILTITNGLQGILRKTRTLFLCKNTRVHFDKVENLGDFIEFEVCLNDEETEEKGENLAQQLMELFDIHEDHLVPVSYFDLLQAKQTN